MIDLDAIQRAAELAHDEQYGAARAELKREPQAEFIAENDCIACRLGGLTSEEAKRVHES